MSRLILLLFFAALFCRSGHAEEILWQHPPAGVQTGICDRVVQLVGPPGAETRQYLLAQVLVDAMTGNPGTAEVITTFFMDDAPVDFPIPISGCARLNVFVVSGPMDLPSPAENPDDGIIVDATFTQNLAKGRIEVRAMNLSLLPQQVVIEKGVRYFIGLTPIFSLTMPIPFGGQHIANDAAKGLESQSAFRSTFPLPIGDWIFAGDMFGPPDQFATIKIEPFILRGDVNCDGSIDLLDVGPFVNLLVSGKFTAKADINIDGAVNLLDVQPFVDLLAGG